jgi:hypothetical protein
VTAASFLSQRGEQSTLPYHGGNVGLRFVSLLMQQRDGAVIAGVRQREMLASPPPAGRPNPKGAALLKNFIVEAISNKRKVFLRFSQVVNFAPGLTERCLSLG